MSLTTGQLLAKAAAAGRDSRAAASQGEVGALAGGAKLQMMKSAVLSSPGKIDFVEVPIPEPGPSQVLIRLEGCGVCASNIPAWEGKPWFSYPMPPGALGHEGWGRVEKLGLGVNEFAVGDRVAMISNNAYAEFDVADASAVMRLPSALGHQPFPAEPLGCAMNVFGRSGIGKNHTVAIIGIGFLGALLTQLADAVGARVVAISRRQFALELARKMGAAVIIPMDDQNRVVEAIKRLTGEKFCEVVVECTGKPLPLELAAELAAIRGRLVIAGYHQDGPRQINMQLWNWRGLDVINAHERDPKVYLEGMKQAVRAVETGLLNPAPLFTHRFPLHRLADGLKLTAEHPDGFIKALIMMQ